MNFYNAFGLTVGSEFMLSELESISNKNHHSDVLIKRGSVDFDNPNALKLFEDVFYIKNENSFCLFVKNIATYGVTNGREIIIDVKKKSFLNEYKIFLYGTCFAALLLQRKQVCLHAAGIITGNKANLFLGYSGLGKSTLTCYFVKNGFKFLGDDVLPLKFNAINQLQVGYSMPFVKIWEESLSKFKIPRANVVQMRDDVQKFRWVSQHSHVREFLSIKQIIILNWTNNNPFSLQKVTPIEALIYLKEHIYRPQFYTESDENVLLLKIISYLANNQNITLVKGIRSFKSLNNIRELLCTN